MFDIDIVLAKSSREHVLCKQALDVQNACNLCGVAQTFASVAAELNNVHVPGFTAAHPIIVLWIDKLASLANVQNFDSDVVSAAYDWVLNKVGAR